MKFPKYDVGARLQNKHNGRIIEIMQHNVDDDGEITYKTRDDGSTRSWFDHNSDYSLTEEHWVLINNGAFLQQKMELIRWVLDATRNEVNDALRGIANHNRIRLSKEEE